MQTEVKIIDLNPPRKSRGIFYLALVCFAVFSSVPILSQSRLKVNDRVKNSGRVPKGESVILVYEIRNAGDQPLRIDSAEVACDCTTASLPREPLAPGSTGTVVVSFDTKSAYGRQDRIVKLYSNDPRGPVKLRFKANVIYR